jgi:enediyne biosynthesis protein E4
LTIPDALGQHLARPLRVLGIGLLIPLWIGICGASFKAEDLSQTLFTDVTEQAGIDFRHVHGGGGENPKRYYIETMGSGVAFFDYDRNGFLDIYAVNGQFLTASAAASASNALYRNEQDGRFVDVTAQAGVGDRGYGMGVVAGDYDNDGYSDLYVTNYGPNVLYRNKGDGRFADVTEAAGIGDPLWGVGCAFLDYDNDGDLDLYVANYLLYEMADADRELKPYLARGIDTPTLMGYPHPDNFKGAPDLLYRNEGNGSFTDVTRQSGIYNPDGKGMGMACSDYDGDGDTDIFVANDQTENFLYRNAGDGSFTAEGLIAGVAYDRDGRTQSGMGADFGDYDNDGDFDLFMTDYQAETNALYHNEGGGFFVDRAFPVGLAIPSLPYVSWGNLFFDYDSDGYRDLFVANGHVLDNAELFDSSSSYHQPNQLFRNAGPDSSGRWHFRDVSSLVGPALQVASPSRGVAGGDYDNDGDIDLFVLNSNLPATLLRNDSLHRNHSLMVRTLGVESNRDGVGARVRVVAGDLDQIAEVRSGSSYLSQNDLRLSFGLGDRRKIERVEVRWLSGAMDVLRDQSADRLITIEEGVGLITSEPF